jgi:uncharacterized spore protein YtfJ
VKELIEDVLSKFEGLSKTKTVVGEPMELKGKILVPLIEVSIGVGGGGGGGSGEGAGEKGMEGKGEGKGAGVGGGMKVVPVSVICVDDKGVSAFTMAEKKGFINKLADIMPQIMERAAALKKEKEEQQ